MKDPKHPIGIYAPTEIYEQVNKRAEAMDVSRATFVLLILAEFLKSGKKLTVTEGD